MFNKEQQILVRSFLKDLNKNQIEQFLDIIKFTIHDELADMGILLELLKLKTINSKISNK